MLFQNGYYFLHDPRTFASTHITLCVQKRINKINKKRKKIGKDTFLETLIACVGLKFMGSTWKSLPSISVKSHEQSKQLTVWKESILGTHGTMYLEIIWISFDSRSVTIAPPSFLLMGITISHNLKRLQVARDSHRRSERTGRRMQSKERSFKIVSTRTSIERE